MRKGDNVSTNVPGTGQDLGWEKITFLEKKNYWKKELVRDGVKCMYSRRSVWGEGTGWGGCEGIECGEEKGG